MKNWDKILDDFARKCKGGTPDMTNPRHLALLRESLIKFGWKENATNAFIGNLREGEGVIFEKRKPGEVWQTQSGWAGLKPGEKSAVYGMKSKEVAQAYVSGQDVDKEDDQSQKIRDRAYKHAEKRLNESEIRANDPSLTDEQVQGLLDLNDGIQKLNDPNTSDEEKQAIAKELVDKYGLTLNQPTIDKDGNPKDVKLYIKKFPGMEGQKLPTSIRKALCTAGGSPNANQTNLVNEINNHLSDEDKIKSYQAGGKNEKQLKDSVSAKAKPNFKNKDGSSTAIKAKNSPKLQSIFAPGTPLGDLKESYHSVEAPTGEDGRMITSDTPEGQRAHLRFLVESNQATKDTIEYCEELAKDDLSFQGVADAVREHEDKMKALLDGKNPPGLKVPSKEASVYVKKIYGEMIGDIYKANPDVAPSIAKQVAENALVSEELAGGEEVYMPTSGVFPGGDKIKVERDGSGQVQGVAGISVKFGRGSQGTEIYGFPANGSSIARFAEVPKREGETDEEHAARQTDIRTRNGDFVGQDGHTIGVRDDLLEEEKQSEVIDQSGLGTSIKDKKKYNEITNEISDEVNKFKEKRRAEFEGELDNWNPPLTDAQKRKKRRTFESAVLRNEIQSHMKKVMSGEHTDPPTKPSLNEQFEEVVDREELMKSLTGTTDGKYPTKDGKTRQHSNASLARGADAIELMNLMALTSTIKEGDGMPSLAHNHQSVENGEYVSETVDPNETDMTDLANWGFQMRVFSTKGRAGGGAQLTGTGESKKHGIR